jgi:hypothetical protein
MQRELLILWAGLLNLVGGGLCVWTYLNPDGNALVRSMDKMFLANFRPKGFISHRTWCLVTGLVCIGVGFLFIAQAVGVISPPER